MKKLCSVLLVVLSGSVSAADLSSQLTQCSKENDSLKRLMCFDQVALKAASKPTDTASTPTVNPVEAAPVVKSTAEKEVIEKTVDVVSTEKVPVKTPAVASASSQRAEDIFGKESIKKMDVVDEVNFTIKTASLSLRKKWRFTFENGQQWEQKDSDKFAKFKSGDQVLIKRGLMNAFYLKKLDANRTIRVKRIK